MKDSAVAVSASASMPAGFTVRDFFEDDDYERFEPVLKAGCVPGVKPPKASS
jgi:hypothetical protein